MLLLIVCQWSYLPALFIYAASHLCQCSFSSVSVKCAFCMSAVPFLHLSTLWVTFLVCFGVYSHLCQCSLTSAVGVCFLTCTKWTFFPWSVQFLVVLSLDRIQELAATSTRWSLINLLLLLLFVGNADCILSLCFVNIAHSGYFIYFVVLLNEEYAVCWFFAWWLSFLKCIYYGLFSS